MLTPDIAYGPISETAAQDQKLWEAMLEALRKAAD